MHAQAPGNRPECARRVAVSLVTVVVAVGGAEVGTGGAGVGAEEAEVGTVAGGDAGVCSV